MYWEKSDSNSVQSYLKIYALFILSMPLYKQFCIFFWLNQTVMGGVSLNSFCQHGRLFALSLYLHFILINVNSLFSSAS